MIAIRSGKTISLLEVRNNPFRTSFVQNIIKYYFNEKIQCHSNYKISQGENSVVLSHTDMSGGPTTILSLHYDSEKNTANITQMKERDNFGDLEKLCERLSRINL